MPFASKNFFPNLYSTDPLAEHINVRSVYFHLSVRCNSNERNAACFKKWYTCILLNLHTICNALPNMWLSCKICQKSLLGFWRIFLCYCWLACFYKTITVIPKMFFLCKIVFIAFKKKCLHWFGMLMTTVPFFSCDKLGWG